MEHLNHLPPFYIGQKVAYITGLKMPKNSIHTVKSIFRAGCDCWLMDIDNEIPEYLIMEEGTDGFVCDNCNKTTENNRNGWQVESFRPLLESPFPSLTMSRVIEKEKELISMN